MNKLIKIVSILFLVVIDLVLIGPLLIPVPPLEDVSPVRELADPDSQFVQIDGIDFHYKRAGSQGPAVVLLHGFGASQYSWREVMPDLGENYRVFAYDRTAFGLTERPTDWTGGNPYTRSASVSHLEGLLDAWDADPAVLIGNSAGGAVAMEFALAHPGEVRALILVSPAVGSGGGPLAGRDWLVETPQIQRIGPLLVRRIAETGPDTIDQAWHDPAKQPADMLMLYEKPLRAENWDLALWYLSTTGEISDLPERLDEFDLPILVITGDDDRIVPTQSTIKIADQLPGAELVVLPECGHLPQEECPQAFMEAVTSFLEGLDL